MKKFKLFSNLEKSQREDDGKDEPGKGAFLFIVIFTLFLIINMLTEIQSLIVDFLCVIIIVFIAFMIEKTMYFFSYFYDYTQERFLFKGEKKYESLIERYRDTFIDIFFECFGYMSLIICCILVAFIFFSGDINSDYILCISMLIASILKILQYGDKKFYEKFNGIVKGMVILGAFLISLSAFGFLIERFNILLLPITMEPVSSIVHIIYKPVSSSEEINLFINTSVLSFTVTKLILKRKDIVPTLTEEFSLIKKELSKNDFIKHYFKFI